MDLQKNTAGRPVPTAGQLIAQNFVIQSLDDLRRALGEQNQYAEAPLGEILVDMGLISAQQLKDALMIQRRERGKHLGRILYDMGLVDSEQVNIALARKFGIPYVQLRRFDITPKVLSLVPADLAIQNNIMPLAEIDGHLVVAMENPLDLSGVEMVRFNTNLNINPVMASSEDIAAALTKYKSKFDEDEALEEAGLFSIEAKQRGAESAQAMEHEATKKPIVRLLNTILTEGVTNRASDINIRPENDAVKIYYRVDGKLQYSRSINRNLLPALVSRVKIIGEMNIAERRVPQEGRARMKRDGNTIDLRLSVIPTVKGESVVIRILDKAATVKPLDQIGMAAPDVVKIRQILRRSHGMFLVVGPTGSGKSTTSYAILQELAKTNAHILTVEDPVEYDMDGIEQVQVYDKIGFTFAETLRRFLRHDPDVIMVGEVRDHETAAIATKAALTGHFVLSTLHTNDAASTISRLLNMGVEPFVLASSLLGVMSQRLIRLNCPHCRSEERVDASLRQKLKLGDTVFYRGTGCGNCAHSGFSGRALVSEILTVGPEMIEAINTRSSTQALTGLAIRGGMTRLFDSALQLARDGRTSLEEALAVRID